jgi:hypothetical protein
VAGGGKKKLKRVKKTDEKQALEVRILGAIEEFPSLEQGNLRL